MYALKILILALQLTVNYANDGYRDQRDVVNTFIYSLSEAECTTLVQDKDLTSSPRDYEACQAFCHANSLFVGPEDAGIILAPLCIEIMGEVK